MNVGVLASFVGTNLQALIDSVHGRDGIQITAVASDRADAVALSRAQAAGRGWIVLGRAAQRQQAQPDQAEAEGFSQIVHGALPCFGECYARPGPRNRCLSVTGWCAKRPGNPRFSGIFP